MSFIIADDPDNKWGDETPDPAALGARLSRAFAIKYGLSADLTYEQAKALDEALAVFLTAALASILEQTG